MARTRVHAQKSPFHTTIAASIAGLLVAGSLSLGLGTAAFAETDGSWEYKVTDSGAHITAYTGSESAVTIPTVVGSATVTEISSGAFQNNQNLQSVIIAEGVTTIGENAFKDCSYLTQVQLPETLVSIGNHAFESTKIQELVIPNRVETLGLGCFQNCTGLKSVTIGSGVNNWITSWGENKAFAGCTLLTKLTITEGVTSIGGCAFEGCTLLGQVTIPSTVTDINDAAFRNCELLTVADVWGNPGNSAFQNCSNLSDVTLHNATKIGDNAFAGDTALGHIDLPDTLLSLGSSAFEGCTKLSGIVIPNSVTYMGVNIFKGDTQLISATLGGGISEWATSWGENGAFENCTKLTSVEVVDGCAYLPSTIFRNCTALTAIDLPQSITSIGDSAFNNCTALASLSMGDRVSSIGNKAFSGCTALRSYNLSTSLVTIGDEAFANTLINEVILSDTVKTIGYKAFANCPLIERVHLGAGVESWNTSWGENSAFENDARLTTLTIEEGALNIGATAFRNCTALTTVETPLTLTSVGAGAFQNCIALTSAHIARGVINDSAFKDCSSLYDVDLGVTTEIAGHAFQGCVALSDIYLPDTLTTIGDSAFDGCTSLQTIDIPDSITYLGCYAFANCTGLIAAIVGNNITSWGTSWGANGAFAYDTALCYAVVAYGADSLGNDLFRGCTALSDVVLPESISSCGSNIFADTSERLKVHVTGSKMEDFCVSQNVAYNFEDFTIPQLSGVLVHVIANAGGSVSPSGDVVKVVGSSQSVTAVPDRGYYVENYYVNGIATGTNEPIVNIRENVTVEVVFTPDPGYIDEYALNEADNSPATQNQQGRQTISIVMPGAPTTTADPEEESQPQSEGLISSILGR
ncbi:MAG: leucine-rich repeat domain-containing protein [Coriobacteriales bacterium]|nr:leucine-rich repeat domain-containing protein [Coriobacteriales bacterium]